MNWLLGLVLIGAAQGPLQPPLAPPGATEEFLRSVLEVERLMEQGDFAAASARAQALPKKQIVIDWDDSKAPADFRGEFAEARDAAIKEWGKMLPFFKVKFGKPADVRISFEPFLPPSAGSNLPAGAVHSVAYVPGEPAVETVIGLQRGNPALPVDAVDVYNEVGFALAYYYGAGQTQPNGSFTGRSDVSMRSRNKPSLWEIGITKFNLELVDFLHTNLEKKKRVAAQAPSVVLQPLTLDLGSTVQGQDVDFTVQASNVGTGPLALRLIPDCGCLLVTRPAPLDAQKSALLRLSMETTDFVGDQHKKVLVYTNDPERPVVELTIKLRVKPVYRILDPKSGLVDAKASEGKHEFYVVVDDPESFRITDSQIDGWNGKVSIERWSGTIADPELNEPPKPKKGYRIKVQLDPDIPNGRLFATVLLRTNHEQFGILRHGMTVQSGIVASPNVLFMGEVGKDPKRMHLFVSRLSKPFKITKVEVDSPYFRVEHRSNANGMEHRVTVTYLGNAEFGLLASQLRIYTDDPQQPVVSALVRASVQ
ncbi:MAG: hypothetical protein CNCCGFBP_02479 [Fimbriimonadaceae bacterium]|nr:hypothetical protein [Fimbriimonadaceae bacterium]